MSWNASQYAARRTRVRDTFDALGIDHLLVGSAVNIRWLTGFTGSAGQVVVGARGDEDFLLTDARYQGRAEREAVGTPVRITRDPGEALRKLVSTARLGVEGHLLPWSAVDALKSRLGSAVTIVPLVGIVERHRATKDDKEIATLQRAGTITAGALMWLVSEHGFEGRSERELAIAFERRMVDMGADAPAFDTIVASGPNGGVPHHEPGDRRVRAGDLVTIDGGARIDGYHADCTRTFAVGVVSEQLAQVHSVVRAAQRAGRQAITGLQMPASTVDDAARSVIVDAGFGDAFTHPTGHGVGLEIHEAPAVSTGSRDSLGAGSTFTVEPGIYLPGIGGVRIEDTLAITGDGDVRILTQLPRSMSLD